MSLGLNNVIHEDSKDFEESVSEESQDIYIVMNKLRNNFPYSDISPNLYDEGNKTPKEVPMFIGSGRLGWSTSRKEIKKVEESKDIDDSVLNIPVAEPDSKGHKRNSNLSQSKYHSISFSPVNKVNNFNIKNVIEELKEVPKTVSEFTPNSLNKQLLKQPTTLKEKQLIQEIIKLVKKEEKLSKEVSGFSRISQYDSRPHHHQLTKEFVAPKIFVKNCR